MAGTTGLEPATSAVTVLLMKMEAMRRSEYNLHCHKGLIEIYTAGCCKRLQRICGTYMGLDGGVMSQSTAQILGCIRYLEAIHRTHNQPNTVSNAAWLSTRYQITSDNNESHA
jgi:hypothetical protein